MPPVAVASKGVADVHFTSRLAIVEDTEMAQVVVQSAKNHEKCGRKFGSNTPKVPVH